MLVVVPAVSDTLMQKLKTSEVFVPGGLPQYTYVPRAARNLEERLSATKDNLCKLVTLTGTTKSGKTVLASRVFPKERSVWVDGGTVSAEDDLWNFILDNLGGYTDLSTDQSKQITATLGGEFGADAGLPLFAHAKAKLAAGGSQTRVGSQSQSRSLSPRSAAIAQLRKTRRPLVIDDFHYLNRPFQGNIVRALKPLVFEGVPVVLIAIPHRKYDAVKVEREMTGRLEPIMIPAWEKDELLAIPTEGFRLLNVRAEDALKLQLAAEAYGSPHLMQEFCRELSRANGVQETAESPTNIQRIDSSLFRKVAEGTGKVVFDKLATGPRQRTDRIDRQLKDGAKVDIYRAVLLALAHLRPGLDTITYEQIRSALRDLLVTNVPQGHEVTRVLEKMSEIASSDEASTPVLDWEREEQKLHITDPFFAFFLKWGMGEAQQGAPPNGGPAMRPDNSGVSGGPPSVS
jgi:hypothetical protein